MIQQTHKANETIIKYPPHPREWRLLYLWVPKMEFSMRIRYFVLKLDFIASEGKMTESKLLIGVPPALWRCCLKSK